jgi:hypothetical protein
MIMTGIKISFRFFLIMWWCVELGACGSPQCESRPENGGIFIYCDDVLVASGLASTGGGSSSSKCEVEDTATEGTVIITCEGQEPFYAGARFHQPQAPGRVSSAPPARMARMVVLEIRDRARLWSLMSWQMTPMATTTTPA